MGKVDSDASWLGKEGSGIEDGLGKVAMVGDGLGRKGLLCVGVWLGWKLPQEIVEVVSSNPGVVEIGGCHTGVGLGRKVSLIGVRLG